MNITKKQKSQEVCTVGFVGGTGCGPVGGVFTSAGVILVLFILLVIVLRGIFC